MGPVKEIKKRKKKKVNPNGFFFSAPSLSQQPLDWWNEFSKRLTGTLSSESKEPCNFESLFKMSRKTFNYICSLVKHDLMAKSTYFVDIHGKPLSLNDCVAVALRRLSSGDSLSIIGESLSINQSTVAQITWRFVEAIEERGLHHLHWPETESSEAEDIKSKFDKLGLPNCCGVVDTTRIVMSFSLDESNNIWRDRDNKHSMILQAIVGPDMRFLDVVSGWPGSLSESVALKNSSFFTLAEESKRLNGKRIKLSDDQEGKELQEYIVGHAGFPLLAWLLTPYNGNTKLSDSQRGLNKQIFAAQGIAKTALFRLKETWKIIGGMMWRPDKNRLPRIILVCCILHNILIDLEDEVQMKNPVAYNYHKSSCKSRVYKEGSKSASGLREMVCLQLSRKKPDPFVD
ncbi:protein ALP1-like [Impatiens glandulifera]|uniref:protein ALP1-like n=1 Tax=Impatiens glandulifera TaxID=253017 RepID=UPI001FB148E4|nr:protein ALP1-like [Impatiens glandulifera]XP_047324125.1 protein ALP1-like [Impatiens glandulifera]XP_047324126.1 protein ALP1-like [Impatiens glandulifera]